MLPAKSLTIKDVADVAGFLNTFSGIEIRPMATASLSPWISVLLFLSHLRCKPFSLSLFLLNSPPEVAFGFGAFAPKDQPGKAFKRTHSTENVEEPVADFPDLCINLAFPAILRGKSVVRWVPKTPIELDCGGTALQFARFRGRMLAVFHVS